MNQFGTYTQGSGTTEFKNPQSRQDRVNEMNKQGLNQVYSNILPPMTFRLFERPDQERPSKLIYCVSWQGR